MYSILNSFKIMVLNWRTLVWIVVKWCCKKNSKIKLESFEDEIDFEFEWKIDWLRIKEIEEMKAVMRKRSVRF